PGQDALGQPLEEFALALHDAADIGVALRVAEDFAEIQRMRQRPANLYAQTAQRVADAADAIGVVDLIRDHENLRLRTVFPLRLEGIERADEVREVFAGGEDVG